MRTDTKNKWLEAVAKARSGQSKQFDKQVHLAFKKHHKKALIPLIGTEEESWEIYLTAVCKFWEKYILAGEELPNKNINGYIYMMCKNVYYDSCRKKNTQQARQTILFEDFNQVKLQTASNNFEDHDLADHFGQQEKTKKSHLHLQLLTKAIERLCADCKSIIEENVLGNMKLVTLREKLKYGGGYQAIVQKKKRCIKKLTKFFYQEISKSKA